MTIHHNPLTWPQYLHVKLGEECGELAQCAGKGLCFGIEDVNPNSGNPNWHDTRSEANDVNTVLRMIGYATKINLLGDWANGASDNKAMLLKEARLVFHAQWALKRGTLVLNEDERKYFDIILSEHAEYLKNFKHPDEILKKDDESSVILDKR